MAVDPFKITGSDELRKRWLDRFIRAHNPTMTEIKKVLLQGSKDADSALYEVASSNTFSSGVRAAQIRLAKKEMDNLLEGMFKSVTTIIKDGQKTVAGAAANALSETDRRFLVAALSSTGDVKSYLESQKLSASIGVANAISRVTKSDIPLSARVYRTEKLANRWVQNQVNSAIMRGSSAKEIAKIAKGSIRPDTPGGVSYAALRLGRTELNNAFHATAITLSQNRPWIQEMGWYLSKTHTHNPLKPEICEDYARHKFQINSVPPKPHPQCRCYVAPILEDFDIFSSRLTSGQYNDWIKENASSS